MSEDANRIQLEMKRVRGELHREFNDVVDSAGEAVNWRVYTRRYPWACVGAAALLGYLAVPRRLEVVRPDAESLRKLAERREVAIQACPTPQPRRGAAGALFHVLANAAVRGAVSYLGQQLAAHRGPLPGENGAVSS